MSRYVKASSAGFNLGRGTGLGSLLLLFVLALIPATASAVTTRPPLLASPITGSGIGVTFSNPTGVEVDEANGNLFVADGFPNEVFDIFGAEGGVPAGIASPYQLTGFKFFFFQTAVALDQSATSPSKGTLYVADVVNGRVMKFIRNVSSEEYEAAGELTPNSSFSFPTGVAVDPDGNVFVSDGSGLIIKFSPTGTQVAVLDVSSVFSPENPSDLAFDSAGDLFVQGFEQVYEFPADGSGEIDPDVFTQVVPSGATGIAVDTAKDELLVARGDHVSVYDATTLAGLGEFGAGYLQNTSRLALNPTTDRVYVADRGTKDIEIFGPNAKVPGLSVEAPSPLAGTSATLRGKVNPDEVDIEECKFEYGPTTAYGITKPCEGAIPTDSSDHEVTSAISGLTSFTTYHFRLIAKNANGTNVTADSTFETPESNKAVTEAASAITGATATLNGIVFPKGLVVSECKFEYGKTTVYGQSVPCAESIPADNGEHPVSAAISGLLANGTTYHYRLVIDGEGGPVKGADQAFATQNTFITGSATAVGDTTATLHGTVRLDGEPLTGCEFEYGLTPDYGASASCVPAFGSIPADSIDHAVTAVLSGLGKNSLYHFRLIATNAAGTITAGDQTFTTLGLPLISEPSAVPLGTSNALLGAQINPSGFGTTYHFEWGTDISYGNRVPAEPDPSIGSGTASIEVSEGISGLEEDTVYHYRVLATNSSGTTEGPDMTFSTHRANASCSKGKLRVEQVSSTLPSGSAFLPDCMALEMVSPAVKFNQYAQEGSFSLNGERAVFRSLAALADTPRQFSLFDEYVATRTASGWVTKPTTLPPAFGTGDLSPCAYAADLSAWTARYSKRSERFLAVSTLFRQSVDGAVSALSPLLAPLNPGAELLPTACGGATADASRVLFGVSRTQFFPGDPFVDEESRANLYEAFVENGVPQMRLVQRDRDGVLYGGGCGAFVGSGGLSVSKYARGAISPDGSLIYFSVLPTQVGLDNCNVNSNTVRILRRVLTPSGPEISEVSASECDRVSPPCSTLDGDDYYRGASQEGNLVFFLSPRQLTNSDRDVGSGNSSCEVGCDLYLYDASRPEGDRLTQISVGDSSDPSPGEGAEVRSVAGFAGDGSRVYFTARGVLTTAPNQAGERARAGMSNRYLYERNAAHPSGRTVFIATGSTGHSLAGPMLGADPEDLSVGGDGHVLAFYSTSPLTPGDADGGEWDLYRYDANSEALERISKALPGGSDDGPFEASPAGALGAFLTENVDAQSMGEQGPPPLLYTRFRTVSEDGRTIVFVTAEALSPGDTDGEESVYVWRDGELNFIPNSRRPSVSLSGEEILFQTPRSLLAEDGDSSRDVYVARIDGGYPIPAPVIPCKGEACQGPPTTPPAERAAASETFTGSGNLKPSGKKQKAKKRQNRSKRKKQKAKQHKSSRAGREQGGQK